ncbi:MAG: alpha/beta hydrolase [Deltaproteobacteria bacterium]|nr:alpha/beta hydrolase [Deltaproteobacteria bacterium]
MKEAPERKNGREGAFAAGKPPEPDDSGFVVAHDGTRIYTESFGPEDAPVMVLTDGIVCNGTFYWYIIRDFRDRMRIIRWVYRGHGRSEAPADFRNLTMDDFIQDLWSVMDHYGLESAIQVGYSMGVQILLDGIHRHPRRAEALVLIAGGPGRPLDTFHGNTLLRSALPLIYSLVLGNKNGITRLWQSVVPTNLIYLIATLTELDGRMIERDLMMPYFEHLSEMDVELFLTVLASAAGHDARPFMTELHHPALVVGGTHDNFTPFSLSEEMSEALPHAELLRVKGGTHSLAIEQPDLVNLKMEDFLTKRGLLPVRKRMGFRAR